MRFFIGKEEVNRDVYAAHLAKSGVILEAPQLLSAFAVIGNAAKAGIQAIRNPRKVSVEESERRLAICRGCEFLVVKGETERCSKCGCHVKWKTLLEAWHCPIGKW